MHFKGLKWDFWILLLLSLPGRFGVKSGWAEACIQAVHLVCFVDPVIWLGNQTNHINRFWGPNDLNDSNWPNVLTQINQINRRNQKNGLNVLNQMNQTNQTNQTNGVFKCGAH